MRPRIFALLAVSAVALVGCGASEPSAQPTVTVTVTAEPKPSASTQPKARHASSAPATATSEAISDKELAEISFHREARARAGFMGEYGKIDEAKYIEALDGYCFEGEPFTVSDVQEFRDVLTHMADERYCQRLME